MTHQKIWDPEIIERFLTLSARPIVLDKWEACFRLNCHSGFRIHCHFTIVHQDLPPASKMRNKVASDVLVKTYY